MDAKKRRQRDPWVPPPTPPHITMALKAVASGAASVGQQRNAMKWIVEELCRTYDWPYRPTSDRDTCVALGMQLVGKHLVHEINLNPALLRSKNDA